MTSLCLSSTSILRCEALSRTQTLVLIFPTSIELIFSTSLIIANRGSGWRHLLLTAEGWTYFGLALLDLLSHIIPAVRNDLQSFRIIDIFIASSSSIPILLYTTFLFLFAQAELVQNLPNRFRRISIVILLVFIPIVAALNEVASFIGISHRYIKDGSSDILTIGFSTDKQQTLWTFFTSITLALFSIYQAVNFSFAFYRIVRALVEQRRIEMASSDAVHLFKGIGWIAGGLKLGAIETVIGFAEGGFGGALTRRVLRFLSRAFLIIGIVRGIDTTEDFTLIRSDLRANSLRREFRKSRLRPFISGPRLSTFQQLSGMSPLTYIKDESRQRVTVHFNGKDAPKLQIHFPALDFPSPSVMVQDAADLVFLPRSPSVNYINRSLTLPDTRPGSILSLPRTTSTFASLHPMSGAVYHNPTNPTLPPKALISDKITSPTSVQLIQFAAQFPAPPPRMISSPLRRAPVSPASHREDNDADLNTHRIMNPDRASLYMPTHSSGKLSNHEVISPVSHTSKSLSIATPSSNPFDYDATEFTATPHSDSSRQVKTYSGSPTVDSQLRTIEWVTNAKMVAVPKNLATLSRQDHEVSSRLEIPIDVGGEAEDFIRFSGVSDDRQISWLHSPSVSTVMEPRTRADRPRIKSVGKAPRRYTPLPVKTDTNRESMSIDHVLMPSGESFSSEQWLENQSEFGTFGSIRSVSEVYSLHDSGVLGMEDMDHLTHGRSFFIDD